MLGLHSIHVPGAKRIFPSHVSSALGRSGHSLENCCWDSTGTDLRVAAAANLKSSTVLLVTLILLAHKSDLTLLIRFQVFVNILKHYPPSFAASLLS